MPTTTPPPDTRPHRAAHEPGDELTLVQPNGIRRVFRQIGWHGQSGAFYSLGEDPSPYEPGSFSPLWLVAHVDDVELPEPLEYARGPLGWWRRWRAQRACWHHDRRTGASWLLGQSIDMGMRKMWWCGRCDRTWFT